jgi:Tryptophan-associated transmembrane protein (Trp_oprn_chp)
MRAPDGSRSERASAGPVGPAGEPSHDQAGGTGGRASLRVTLLVLVVGVFLVVIGAGRSWAGLQAAVSVPSLGSTRVGTTSLTGNDLAPLSGLALLALVLIVGIAVTRGRWRWVVGVVLLALAATLLVQTSVATARASSEAERRARQGEIVGVPAGGDLRVSNTRTGPLLALAGGVLLALAGVETLRRGASWPTLGAAFRAPQDRPDPPSTDGGEPPWEGD